MRACLGLPGRPCGRLSTKSRCPSCAAALARQRRSQPGYVYDTPGWRRLSRQTVAAQPWCSYCGSPATPGNPLGADHVVPRIAGGPSVPGNVRMACRRWNSAKGSR